MDNNYLLGIVLICLFIDSAKGTDPFVFDAENNVVVTAREGSDITLPCSLENVTVTNQVNWTGPNGQQLTSGKTILITNGRFTLQVNWGLRIENVSKSDNGTYTCATNDSPPQQKEAVLTVLESTAMNETTTSEPTSVQTSEPTTEDPNQCSASRPCQNGGICAAGVCNCSADYTGVSCQFPTECPPGACNVNNTKNCTVKITGDSYTFQCDCHPLYKGGQCEIYDHCEFYPCLHNGRCNLLYPKSGYTCDCRTGDPNKDCKLNDNEDNCKTRPPSSENAYITCIDKIGSYKMYCSPGYGGEKQGCHFGNQPVEDFCTQKGPDYCQDEGFCKPLCNVDECNGTKNCEFTADPYNTTGFLSKPGCVHDFGDGYDHIECHAEETLFDGFDKKINTLLDCSPFFDTICTRDFGNGDCRPECNNEDCLFDGFDCSHDNRTDLTGVVVVELKDSMHTLEEIQKRMSLMLRCGVNLTVETHVQEPVTLLQAKVSDTVFTDIEYAGKFLAAAVAKRPEWLDGVHIKDIYTCPAGKYSHVYSDKCGTNCGACIQNGDICDWKTGECLYGCQPAHWGERCAPCDTCVQKGDVCEMFTGMCIFGCKPGYYGDNCRPCAISCKTGGDICNNKTGECLNGCISNEFYGPKCQQCPQNCVGGCNDLGYCDNCSSGWYGKTCSEKCDRYCQNDTCNTETGICVCEHGTYWHEHKNFCEFCSTGCASNCDVKSGACACRDGYHGSRCDFHCKDTCLNGTCNAENGICSLGCDTGFYGPMCTKACPSGCNGCSRDDGACGGNCKPGFEGSNCERKAGKQPEEEEDTTDNTGVIIGVVISLILVVLIIAIACCYWRKRQSGNYVMEDEEMEGPMVKDSNTVEVHTNMHMQPASPLLGHSMDMIELDEKHHTVVYAGPERGQTSNTADNLTNDNKPTNQNLEADTAKQADDKTDEKTDDKTEETADDADEPDSKRNERCTSSVTMEIGRGGKVLSVSDGDEMPSPTLNKEVELAIGEEAEHDAAAEDDSAFAEPPHSPLGEVRAPLASEENILASLGPKEIKFDKADEPAMSEQEKGEETKDEDKKSQRSRSSSSSSSSSSSKSGKGTKEEITTEM